MKTATYRLRNEAGEYIETDIEYDPSAPCVYCEKPVETASMGGTVVCPWCDMGCHRDGAKWTYRETVKFFRHYQERMEK